MKKRRQLYLIEIKLFNKMLIMVISNFVRKYIFAYIFLFSQNVIVNMYINVYFISVRELQNTYSSLHTANTVQWSY